MCFDWPWRWCRGTWSSSESVMVEMPHSLQTPGSCSPSILRQIYKWSILITYTLSELTEYKLMFLYSYHVPKCGSSRWGCSWYPFIIAVGGNKQCYKAETVHPAIANTLIGVWGSLRMTVLPKNLSMVRSLVNASLWTSGRLEMSSLVSSVSLKPPNRDSFPAIPGSPCSPFSTSGKAILLDFSVTQLQRLTSVFLDTSNGLVSLLLAFRVSQRNSYRRRIAWKTNNFFEVVPTTRTVYREY